MAKSHRTEAQNRTLAAALTYAEFGWSVMPVDIATKKPHKAARHSNGKRWGATRDPKQIDRDFRKWPNAAIGVPTGIDNGIWVLDADTVEGHGVDGIANLQALIDANGPLPETRMARSPSGSIHYFFTDPKRGMVRNSDSTLAPGVDVRGEGGYALVAPSVKPAVGAYEWLNHAGFKYAPPWLVTLVTEKPTKYQPGDPQSSLSKVSEALDILSNDGVWIITDIYGEVVREYKGWDGWNTIALSIYRATSGSDEGYEIFRAWCAKNTIKYNEEYTRYTWYNRFTKCPPITVGVGTLFALVDEEEPGWQRQWNEEYGDDDDASEQEARS
jgi:hypothetical protein